MRTSTAATVSVARVNVIGDRLLLHDHYNVRSAISSVKKCTAATVAVAVVCYCHYDC